MDKLIILVLLTLVRPQIALANKVKKYSYNNVDLKFQLGARTEAVGSAVSNIIMPAGGIQSSLTEILLIKNRNIFYFILKFKHFNFNSFPF